MNINKILSSFSNGYAVNKVKPNKNGALSAKTSAALDKSDFRTVLSTTAENYDFSAELNRKIEETAGDIKKQASIERKNEVIQQVKSNQYTVDARALAAKLNFVDFNQII